MTASLQKRLSAILGLALAVSGVTSYLILRTVIAPAFNTLESDVARTDLTRATLGIDGQLQQMRAIVGDWAPWDQVNDFALGNDPDFIYRNIDQSTLENLNIDLLQLYEREGGKLADVSIAGGEFASVESFGRFGADDPVNTALTGHADPGSVVSGMLMTARGPMMLVSMPLLDEADTWPINGTIVMGRLLTQERLQELRDHIKVDFDILPITGIGDNDKAALRGLEGAPADTVVQIVEGSAIHTYSLLDDIGGDPLALLQARTAQDVSTLGHNAANVALLLFVVTSLAMLGFLWVLLRLHIVRPLAGLAAHMAGIRKTGDLSAPLPPTRNDEIGRLAVEFNALTSQLQEARRQLVDHSFNAGRADTAAEVLHNIRNAMTPVVDVAQNLSTALDEITSLRFRQAADELADEECAGQRRRDLLRYLIAAADRTQEVGSSALGDVDLICEQSRLVEEILTGQEKASRATPLRQQLNLAEVVREACNVLPRQAVRDVDIRVAPEIANVTVIGIRVQILQILGNVIMNAYEAIQCEETKPGCIEIFAARKSIDDVEVVQLSIRDDGVGIEQDSLTRIFQRGFTSKSGTGSGLGLHWCANAVGAFGGSIRVESPGPGKGSTVHIILPIAASASADGIEQRAPGAKRA